jgi:hypothetical protein
MSGFPFWGRATRGVDRPSDSDHRAFPIVPTLPRGNAVFDALRRLRVPTRKWSLAVPIYRNEASTRLGDLYDYLPNSRFPERRIQASRFRFLITRAQERHTTPVEADAERRRQHSHAERGNELCRPMDNEVGGIVPQTVR